MDELLPIIEAIGGLIPLGTSQFVPMTSAELSNVESIVGVRLPTVYGKFLMTFGTSMFREIVEVHPLESLPSLISEDGTVDVGAFYGAESESYGKHLWLSLAINAYRDRMPRSVIPICDCSGNQICIGLEKHNRGKVYYWDHNNEWDEDDYFQDYGRKMPAKLKFQNLHLIADSFEDFIRRLSVDKTL